MGLWWAKGKESITINLDTDVLTSLRTYSDNQKISLDALVNQILYDYVGWWVSAAKAGWVPIQKPLLIALANALDEESLSKIASTIGKNTTKDFLLAMRGEYDAKELISFLKTRAKVAGFPYNEVEASDHIKFIMQHEMGRKWSQIFKSFYQSVFEDLKMAVNFDLTENSLIFNLKRAK
ncbi:MAG: hypothetical protein ACE5J2_04535 [Nitrososphaerales archaeon]